MSGGFIKKNSREREQAFLALGCWLGRGLGRGSRLGLLGGPGRALHRDSPGMLRREPLGALALEGDDVVADEVHVGTHDVRIVGAGGAMIAKASVRRFEVHVALVGGTEAERAVAADRDEDGAAGLARRGRRGVHSRSGLLLFGGRWMRMRMRRAARRAPSTAGML